MDKRQFEARANLDPVSMGCGLLVGRVHGLRWLEHMIGKISPTQTRCWPCPDGRGSWSVACLVDSHADQTKQGLPMERKRGAVREAKRDVWVVVLMMMVMMDGSLM